jgi:NADH-ubiquinone oxidoreductase chain 5
MYLIIIILPLLSSIVSGLLGRIVGTKGAHKITSICIIITTILSLLVFIEVGINNIPVHIDLCK